MKIASAHRLLITSAVVGSAVFAAWSAWMFTTVGESTHLLGVILAGSLSAGGAMYLNRFVKEMKERGEL